MRHLRQGFVQPRLPCLIINPSPTSCLRDPVCVHHSKHLCVHINQEYAHITQSSCVYTSLRVSTHHSELLCVHITQECTHHSELLCVHITQKCAHITQSSCVYTSLRVSTHHSELLCVHITQECAHITQSSCVYTLLRMCTHHSRAPVYTHHTLQDYERHLHLQQSVLHPCLPAP